MAGNLAQAKHDLAVANRIVSHEGIIDAFGHVSMRHPTNPNRYLISRSRSPEVVEASDIYEYTLDSEPVTPLPPGRLDTINGCEKIFSRPRSSLTDRANTSVPPPGEVWTLNSMSFEG